MTATKKNSWLDASIAPAFNVAGAFFKTLSKEIEDSARSSASTAATGQVSLFRLEPENLTHKQKIAVILNKIEKGELVIAPGKSALDIVAELSKPEHDGKSIKTMIAELKTNNEFLIDELKLRAPKPTLRLMQAFRPSFAA